MRIRRLVSRLGTVGFVILLSRISRFAYIQRVRRHSRMMVSLDLLSLHDQKLFCSRLAYLNLLFGFDVYCPSSSKSRLATLTQSCNKLSTHRIAPSNSYWILENLHSMVLLLKMSWKSDSPRELHLSAFALHSAHAPLITLFSH